MLRYFAVAPIFLLALTGAARAASAVEVASTTAQEPRLSEPVAGPYAQANLALTFEVALSQLARRFAQPDPISDGRGAESTGQH